MLMWPGTPLPANIFQTVSSGNSQGQRVYELTDIWHDIDLLTVGQMFIILLNIFFDSPVYNSSNYR